VVSVISSDMVEVYEKCFRKFGLPSSKDLVELFDIKDFDDESTLIDVRREICDRLFEISKELEEIIYPESTSSYMHEASDINDKVRGLALDCYKKLRLLFRFGQVVGFSVNDDGENSKYIRRAFDSFSDVKKNLKVVFSELTSSWEKNDLKGKKEDYFG